MTATVAIDDEFRALIPPLRDDERAQLEANLVAAGRARDPLVTWHGILLDGHNRYEICTRLGLPYATEELAGAESRDDAKLWIYDNQIGRRNLNESQRALLAAGRATLGRGERADRSKDLSMTQATAAEMFNVSVPSVKRAGKVLDQAPDDVVRAVRAGALSVSLAAEVADLPPEVQEVVAAAPVDQMREVAREEVKRAHVANNSGNNEWYTPAEYIRRARDAMGGIDLDPASSEVANRTVGATKFYTADDDGLAKQWRGRVWMNPPYAQPLIAQFCEKLVDAVSAGEVEQAVVLVNNGTETQWFQALLHQATAVCFPQGRVRFLDPEGKPSGAPLQGQAVLYFGVETHAFAQAFNSLGRVCWTVSEHELMEIAGV